MMKVGGARAGHPLRFDFRFDLVEVQGAPVAEPSAVTAVGMALAGLFGFRRVRRR